MDYKCNEERRFIQIEDDIKELKVQFKENSADIRILREEQAETRVYVKQIFNMIEELKTMFKSKVDSDPKIWSTITIKAIEMIGIVAGVLTGAKLLG